MVVYNIIDYFINMNFCKVLAKLNNVTKINIERT